VLDPVLEKRFFTKGRSLVIAFPDKEVWLIVLRHDLLLVFVVYCLSWTAVSIFTRNRLTT
jgi:hypothetical protein